MDTVGLWRENRPFIKMQIHDDGSGQEGRAACMPTAFTRALLAFAVRARVHALFGHVWGIA